MKKRKEREGKGREGKERKGKERKEKKRKEKKRRDSTFWRQFNEQPIRLNVIGMCCLAGGRCAVHATRHCTPSSGPASCIHPPHHLHLPEPLCWHSSPGCAAQRHAGARGAAMPATVAKEGTATWLPVLTWLPGQLPDPPVMATLHDCLSESSTYQ